MENETCEAAIIAFYSMSKCNQARQPQTITNMDFQKIISLRKQIIELKKELDQERERKNLAVRLISKLMDENGELKRAHKEPPFTNLKKDADLERKSRGGVYGQNISKENWINIGE